MDINKKKKIALAGNPNVGKSTVFNALTGLKQHTGNWPGKTVQNASGMYTYQNQNYEIFDLPGTYSLIAHSKEEEVARDFICFGGADVTIIVCDAVCLERNLNLVLQTIEIHPKSVVCVNLLDEAKKKKITIDLKKLSTLLGVPVVGTSARSGKGLKELMEQVHLLATGEKQVRPISFHYKGVIEKGINELSVLLKDEVLELNARWVALKMIDDEPLLQKTISSYIQKDLNTDTIQNKIAQIRTELLQEDILLSELKDEIVGTIVNKAEEIAKEVCIMEKEDYNRKDRKIDKILTNRWTGIPIMVGLLVLVFYITIIGANYPSQLLSDGLFWVSDQLRVFFLHIHMNETLISILLDGIYKVLAWVVAVMLPPMAGFKKNPCYI